MVDVEAFGRDNGALPHQMDERAVQWFDPHEGVCDGPEAVGDHSHAEEGLTTWTALSNWLHRRSGNHYPSPS